MADMKIRTDYKRITDIRECSGKVVDFAKHVGDGIGIRFTDTTYLYLEPHHFYDCDDVRTDADVDVDAALSLRLIGEDEHARIYAERRAVEDRRQRQQYEQLRAKFGS